ncbi:hypothetical protein [Pseudomonas ogarae]|uniref:hypothetical protein n=1 Tax=Pseudomonas ogarae (strain DSM 112162 / CECT 30235 / F113) TaxID=1114970 RepID=UPI00023B3BB8|nr:hypothetical protein [Pseudomonas ogarae]AEV61869.1 integron gene cassette protein [Pseudomonas ogarae]
MGSSKFEDPRLGVYCCGHMFRRERSALLVVREEGDWQFLCGCVDHNDPLEPYHVSIGVLLDVDPTLNQIADLPPEWEAERTEVGGDWQATGIATDNLRPNKTPDGNGGY